MRLTAFRCWRRACWARRAASVSTLRSHRTAIAPPFATPRDLTISGREAMPLPPSNGCAPTPTCGRRPKPRRRARCDALGCVGVLRNGARWRWCWIRSVPRGLRPRQDRDFAALRAALLRRPTFCSTVANWRETGAAPLPSRPRHHLEYGPRARRGPALVEGAAPSSCGVRPNEIGSSGKRATRGPTRRRSNALASPISRRWAACRIRRRNI